MKSTDHPQLEAATVKLLERVVALIVARAGKPQVYPMSDIKSVNDVSLHLKIVNGSLFVSITRE